MLKMHLLRHIVQKWCEWLRPRGKQRSMLTLKERSVVPSDIWVLEFGFDNLDLIE